MPDPHVAGRTRARLAAVALGLVVGLALDEGALRVAGLVHAGDLRERRAGNAAGRPVVAFVGDSNVFGLYVPPEQTLAKCVERLSRLDGSRGVHTENYGRPGAASWVALDQAREALLSRPIALVARCGINNYSTVPPGEGLGPLERLRLTQLARRMVFSGLWSRERAVAIPSGIGGEPIPGGSVLGGDGRGVLLVKPRDGDDAPLVVTRVSSPLGFGAIEPRLRADLAALADLAASARIPLVLATYLAGSDPGFRELRALTATFAKHPGVRVADCARALERAVAEAAEKAPAAVEARGAARAALLTRDQHPTPLGYEMEARIVAQALHEAGALPGYRPELASAPAVRDSFEIPVLRRAEGAQLAFEIVGKPGDVFSLVLGAPGRSEYAGAEISIDAAPFAAAVAARHKQRLTAKADDAGRARIEVPDEARDTLSRAARGEWRAACVISRGGTGGAAQVFATPAIPIR